MRKVASLAEEVKRRRRAVVPLSHWSEGRGGTVQRAYGVWKLAAPLRETVREAIGDVGGLYRQARPKPKEPSGEEFRDARTKLAEAGSIAEDSEPKLAARLRAAPTAYHRPEVTPIP